ncbi:MAG: hypothetical protein V2I43_10790, partial [Parvularcula sp.]|nr:hypothetical protein [Parvularcula sp.]
MSEEFSSSVAAKFCIFADQGGIRGFRTFALNGAWKIALDDSLEIFEVTVAHSRIGWLLGDPIDLVSGRFVDSAVDLPSPPVGETPWQQICRRFAGSWLYIATDGDNIELRPDACATIGTVFEPASRRFASYACILAQEDYFDRLNQGARAANQVDQDGWFTGGLTAHRGIYRLLPNHCVSSSDFVQRRLPVEMPAYTTTPDAMIEELLHETRTVISAVRKSRRTYVALTGGNETRALLAASRDDTHALTFVTLSYETDSLDLYLS